MSLLYLVGILMTSLKIDSGAPTTGTSSFAPKEKGGE